MAVEQYIFNADVTEAFYEKLDELHDNHVHHLLLNGVAEKGADLESIKMTKNPEATREYCQRVVGGLVNLKPSLIARLVEDKLTKLECVFTKINDKESLDYFYMIQNVMDWPQLGKYSCQIWYLGDTKTEQIKKIWE